MPKHVGSPRQNLQSLEGHVHRQQCPAAEGHYGRPQIMQRGCSEEDLDAVFTASRWSLSRAVHEDFGLTRTRAPASRCISTSGTSSSTAMHKGKRSLQMGQRKSSRACCLNVVHDVADIPSPRFVALTNTDVSKLEAASSEDLYEKADVLTRNAPPLV